jgi:AcrR family transcriptional regulator
MAKRPYRMKKRAAARDETRERIVRATMQLHDEHGVATTPFAAVAERAGVGTATVYRNFPTLDSLVQACGVHVWHEMQPPVPDEAAKVFAGLTTREERLKRLVEELDAFYRRGELRLVRAGQDRDRVPGLDAFLKHVEAGVEALVREAIQGATKEEALRVAAIVDFRVWLSLKRLKLPRPELFRLVADLVACALRDRKADEHG